MIFIRIISSFFPFCSKNEKIEKWHRYRPIFHYSIFTWKIEKCQKYFDQNFHFFSILIDRKFENWIMICNFWQFLLISVWIKKWIKAYISSIFPLFPCKKVTKFDHFLTPSTYFTSSQMLITKETAKKITTRDPAGMSLSRQISVRSVCSYRDEKPWILGP